MMLGFLVLLFIGFSRIGHFAYIRRDQMVSGTLNVTLLSAIGTYWRYSRSLDLNQSKALLTIGAVVRSRVRQACELVNWGLRASVSISTPRFLRFDLAGPFEIASAAVSSRGIRLDTNKPFLCEPRGDSFYVNVGNTGPFRLSILDIRSRVFTSLAGTAIAGHKRNPSSGRGLRPRTPRNTRNSTRGYHGSFMENLTNADTRSIQ